QFELSDVELKPENMTPRTVDEVYKSPSSKKTAIIPKKVIRSIPLAVSQKGAFTTDKPFYISSQVNFATDAETYHLMQELYADDEVPVAESLSSVEGVVGRMLFGHVGDFTPTLTALDEAIRRFDEASGRAAAMLKSLDSAISEAVDK